METKRKMARTVDEAMAPVSAVGQHLWWCFVGKKDHFKLFLVWQAWPPECLLVVLRCRYCAQFSQDFPRLIKLFLKKSLQCREDEIWCKNQLTIFQPNLRYLKNIFFYLLLLVFKKVNFFKKHVFLFFVKVRFS